MSLPQLFGRKSETNIVSRVKTATSKKESLVNDAVEAGLYPARVNSRKGLKLLNFAIKVTGVVLLLFILASIAGVFEPIRHLLKDLRGETGGIIVSSPLMPVNIYLDGQLLGTSPYNGQMIATGIHELKVEAKDNVNSFFAPLVLPVQVNVGNVSVVTVNIAPTADLGSYTVIFSENRVRALDPVLIVKALPADAMVLIDGVTVGRVPVIRNDLSEGVHKLTIVKDGFKSFEIDLAVTANKTVTVESKLYEYQLKLK